MEVSKERIERAAEIYDLVSDDDLLRTFDGTNFGASLPREIVADTLLKLAAGYSTGYTALTCCRELGLVSARTQVLTKKGRRYLYVSCKAADDSAAWQIAEKLAEALEMVAPYIPRPYKHPAIKRAEDAVDEALAAYQEARKQVTDRVGE